MSTTEKPLHLLHDLEIINSERIARYRELKQDTGKMDIDLSGILSEMIQESHIYIQELADKIHQVDGVTLQGRKPGAAYDRWFLARGELISNQREALLSFCLKEEQALLSAYQMSLPQVKDHEDFYALLERHYHMIKNQLERFNNFRNAL